MKTNDLITVIKACPTHWKGTRTAALSVLLLLLTSPLCAQPTKLLSIIPIDTQENGAELKVVNPSQQLEITRLALAQAEKEKNLAREATRGNSGQEARERYRLLDRLVTRLNSQLSLINEHEELRHTRTVAAQKAGSWSAFPEPPPYSLLMVDKLMRSLLIARAKLQGLITNQELFAQQSVQFRESAKQAHEMERLALDRLERVNSPEERLAAARQKEMTELKARNADAMAVSIALRYEVIGERRGVAEIEVELLERQLAVARGKMIFSKEDLSKALALLNSDAAELERELENSLVRDSRSKDTLTRTENELKAFIKIHGAAGGSPHVGAQRKLLEAKDRAALAWVESSRFETEVVSSLIAVNKRAALLWEKRYVVVTGQDAEKRREIIAEFQKRRERLQPWLKFTQQQLDLYRASEREQEALLANLDGQEESLRAAGLDRLAAVRLQLQLAERQKTAVEQADIEQQSWLEDIERVQQSRSFLIRLKNGCGIVTDILQHVWRFELFAVEDSVEVAGQKVITSRGVTVGKSVGAIFLFLVGYMISAFLSRRVQRIMVTRFRVGEHQANVIRRWLLALTIFLLLIITLNLARIPLTVFAFLGGALAIGVGFGTQTLIKNFICGILILLERNVKVGDTIDVDGVVGRIVTVDIRASTILGFDGVETVIPNSMFLDNKVTNWTHTNARLRRIVRIGVAYGSPTTRVRDVLVECGKAHRSILKDPPPEALFEDFGDNSLIFALYFWVEHGSDTNPLLVASDLRFMIEQRFAEENISIAFPQRDIHLDTAQPLRVEVIR